MKYNSFPLLVAMGSLLCLLALLLGVEAFELSIFDEAVSTSIRLDVFSHRTITLGSGRNYVLSCSSYSAVWSSNLITNPPNDNTTSAAFYEGLPSKRNLMLQNFDSALSGNYTCSVMGEEKSVTILSSNPAVVTSTKRLFLTLGDTPSHNEREQRILTYGNPSPTFSDIRWFLNDTIPVSTLSGITVKMNGLTFPALTTYELSGKYTVVVNTSAGMVQDSFTVLVGIAPFPVVTPSTIQAVVGERMNITCVDTQAVPPPQFYWSKCPVKNNCTRLENGQDDLVFLSTRSNTTVLIMNPVLLTYGGLYRCDAENGIKRTGRDVAVELSLPQPQSVNVSVTPGPYFAGHIAQLICTASLRLNTVVEYNSIVSTFVWKKGNQIMNTSNGRLLATDLMTKGSFRSQRLTIDPLSHSHDSHQQYHCEVVLAVYGTDITSLPMTSPAVPIDVTVPLTEFHVSPMQITALDVSPYNEFNITCSTENHRNFSLEYRWFNGKDELSNGQDGISISSDGSVINIVASMAGFYTVSCKVRGSLLVQELFNVELKSLITIRGPSVPLLPTGLTITRIEYDQVDIELLINSISYTPEQYLIVYGTNSQYQYRSDVYTGTNDISTKGERVTITLTNLRYDQQYQYRLVVRNSAGTVESQVFTFRTEAIVLLQVRAGPFQGCLADKVLHSSSVSEFFRTTIVEAINRKCFCNFPITNLINGTMLCPQDGSRDLIYRGYLVRLDHLTSNQLLSYADAWIKSKPHVPSGVAVVQFNPNCSTTVSSMNESVCPRNYMSPLADQGFLFDNAVIFVLTVVVALLLILVVIVLILIGVVVTLHKQKSFLKRQKNEITRQESSESTSDGSASGTSGSAESKNDAVIISSETPPPTVSGFAERQGVDWSKGTSVTACPAYTTVYLPGSEPSDARQDDDSTPASSPIPCIYDTIFKVPRGIHYGTTNPRLAVISCADDDDDDDIDDSSTECETVGL